MNRAPQSEPAAVVACMRNEGLFVLEWLAYHLEIGFARAVICTNDCTDGSDTLLDLLADRGQVTHLRHSPAEGQAPQDSGIRAAMAALDGSETVWLLFIDADEFLNIRLGQGHVADLLANAGESDVIALPWRFFGNAGLADWPLAMPPANVIETFPRAEAEPDAEQVNLKSMFRRAAFAHAHDHMPQAPRIARPRVVSAAGEALENRALLSQRKYRKYQPLERAIRLDAAYLNHYAVKSDDLFLLKNHRGDGQNGPNTFQRYHLGWKWHRAANQNTIEDLSILRHLPGMNRRLADWRADPAIAEAEAACDRWFVDTKNAILTPQRRAAWTHAEAV